MFDIGATGHQEVRKIVETRKSRDSRRMLAVRRKGSIATDASIRPPHDDEIKRFKATVRQIANHELEQSKAACSWWKAGAR